MKNKPKLPLWRHKYVLGPCWTASPSKGKAKPPLWRHADLAICLVLARIALHEASEGLYYGRPVDKWLQIAAEQIRKARKM